MSKLPPPRRRTSLVPPSPSFGRTSASAARKPSNLPAEESPGPRKPPERAASASPATPVSPAASSSPSSSPQSPRSPVSACHARVVPSSSPPPPPGVDPPGAEPQGSESPAFEPAALARRTDTSFVARSEALPSLNCADCARPVDDVLVLACHHNLCLLCAVACFRGVRRTRRDAQADALQCPKCGMVTHLPASTVATLGGREPPRVDPDASATDPLSSPASASTTPSLPFLCAQCEAHAATVFCRGCVANYCDACALTLHERHPRLANHKFRLLPHAHALRPEALDASDAVPLRFLLPVGGRAAQRGKLRETSHVRTFEDFSPEDAGPADPGASPSLLTASPVLGAPTRRGGCGRLAGVLGSSGSTTWRAPPGAAETGSEETGSEARGRARGGEREESVHSSALGEVGADRTRFLSRLLKRAGEGGNVDEFLHLCSISNLECDVHPGEPVRFFCMTCRSVPCLCTQCILTREHATHALQPIRQAWADIRSRHLEDEFRSAVGLVKADVDAVKQVLRDKRLEWGKALFDDRGLITQTGELLKDRLGERQENLLTSLATFTTKFAFECDAFRKIVEERAAETQRAMEDIRAHKNSLDSLLLLSFCRDRHDGFTKLLDEDYPSQVAHLPDSRQAILDQAAQVTEEICALVEDLREGLWTCDGSLARRRAEEAQGEERGASAASSRVHPPLLSGPKVSPAATSNDRGGEEAGEAEKRLGGAEEAEESEDTEQEEDDEEEEDEEEEDDEEE
ncbi:UNVERIFIED_CONTAM: B-box zinc finger domain-containing protein [Hammondia hammondi]|eukprot:XP_008885133.1 B-box zinc finger domain-containing protein [Hammondia hammondi]